MGYRVSEQISGMHPSEEASTGDRALMTKQVLLGWENRGLTYKSFDPTAENMDALALRLARTLLVQNLEATRERINALLSQMLASHGRNGLLATQEGNSGNTE